MALPTTRRGRFLHRKAKYQRQSRRASKNRRCANSLTHLVTGVWYPDPPYSCKGDGTKQTSHGIVGSNLAWQVPAIPIVDPLAFSVTRHGKYGQWVSKWNHTLYPIGTRHFEIAVIGFHRRIATYRGRKLDRLSGPDRLRSLVTMYIAAHGDFPDGDWAVGVSPW